MQVGGKQAAAALAGWAILILLFAGWSVRFFFGHDRAAPHEQTAANATTPTTEPSPSVTPAPSPIPAGIAADLSHLPTVYSTKFSSPPDEAWSARELSHTPKTHSPFLGQFGNETVTFAVHALPPHEFLHLTFKLYIINTWDGIAHHNGGTRIGPDYWSLDLVGGPNLIRTTFSNTNGNGGFAEAAKFQNYPAPIPSTPVLWGTGSDSKNELGYEFKFKGVKEVFPMDTVYTIDLTLPHSASAVAFDLTGAELQDLKDEGWGIADVKLEALPAAGLPAFNPANFEPLFSDAIGDEAFAANKAFWQLATAGDWTVAFLLDHVRWLGIDVPLARRAVQDLSSADPDQQRRAAAILSGMGPAVEPLLDAAAARGSVDPLLLQHIREAIVLRPIESTDRRRGAVASRLLQVINTEKSRAALAVLQARVSPEDWAMAMAGAYSIDDGQWLKYVPPPLAKAREDYWPRRQRFQNLMNGDDPEQTQPMPSQMVFRMYDNNIDLTTDVAPVYWQQTSPGVWGPPPGLRGILMTIGVNLQFQPKGPRIFVPPTMDDITLTGDWLVRRPAKQADLLAALEPIVKEQTGRAIHFQSQKIDEAIIDVSGAYAFTSLNADPADRVLLFAGETLSPDDTPQMAGNTEMYGFLQTLSSAYHVRFVNASPIKGTVAWQFRKSSGLDRPQSPEQVDAVLKNVTRQTGLQFKRSTQPTDALVAVETLAAKK